MAYENYRFVSWSFGTPLTGDRFAQMSTNIEQVKEATDDNPRGLVEIVQVTDNVPDTTGWADFAEREIIALKEIAPSDNRVTLPPTRWYRLTLVFPGIIVKGRGAEDSHFYIRMYDDITPIPGAIWRFTPHPFSFYNVSSDPNQTTLSVKNNAYPSRIGAGTYSIVLDSIAGFTNKSFSVKIKREQGASSANAPAYYIPSADSTMQFYVEDIGGN
jgi:hypothetical protein